MTFLKGAISMTRKETVELLAIICANYQREAKTPEALAQLWGHVFSAHRAEDVTGAAFKHMLNPERGRFFPNVADIIYHLEPWRRENRYGITAIAPPGPTERAAMDRMMKRRKKLNAAV